MEIVWFVLILIVLWGIIQVAGRVLPSTSTEMRSDKIEATPSTVWAILINHGKETEWRSDVITVDKITTGSDGSIWQEKRRNGKTVKLKTVQTDAPKKLVREIVDNKEMGGTLTYLINPLDDNYCELKIEQKLEVKKPWQRVKSYILSNKAESIERYIHDVKQRAVHLKDLDVT